MRTIADVEPAGAVVRHRDGLAEALRFVVHAALADRIDVAPVRLGLRMHQRVAVHLARRRLEEPGAVARAPVRAAPGCRGCRRRGSRAGCSRNRPATPGWRGSSPHRCRRVSAWRTSSGCTTSCSMSVKSDRPVQVLDVLAAAGDEVVDAHHGVAPLEQRIAQVRPEEPGASGDEDPHQRRPTPSYSNPASRTSMGSSRFRVSTMVRAGAGDGRERGEIDLGELRPLGEHDDDIGPGARRDIGSSTSSIPSSASCLVGRQLAGGGRIEGDDAGADPSQLGDDRERGRFAQVVGAGLERQAERTDRDAA